jgi:hypothetical protein
MGTFREGFVRPVLLGGMAPAQPVAVYEDDAAQNPPIIDPGLAAAFGKILLKPCHLLVRQPIQVPHSQSPRRA